MTEFDHPLMRPGELGHELDERGGVFGAERRRQLQLHRSDAIAERLDRPQELGEIAMGFGSKSPVVGDRAGSLEREPEVVGSLVNPAGNRGGGRCRVERRVAFDRIAPGGVLGQSAAAATR